MRSITLLLAAALLATVVTAPAEAGRRAKRKGCCAKTASRCCSDSGYRAAEWGGSVYHTSETCKAVAQIPKEKLVTDLPAMYGRKKHCCCGGCK